jgi:hypothetical protein
VSLQGVFRNKGVKTEANWQWFEKVPAELGVESALGDGWRLIAE